jgi:hypothetical protein
VDVDSAFSMHNQYSMLDLSDLLLARERHHVELMRKQNVIGTAVGPSDAQSNRNVNASHNRQDTGEEKDRRLKARC